MVRDLTRAGAAPETASRDGKTALGRAAVGGHAETVAVLLEAGARVDRPEAGGRTPLILAALGDRPDVLRLLIGAGAQVDAREAETGNTALMLAAN